MVKAHKLTRILVVDDSRLMRKSMARILGKTFDIVEAENGEQAWQKLQEDDEIALVCCDLSMPVMDGIGFMKQVRTATESRYHHIPVIIVTSQEDTEENRKKVFEQGAAGFLSKPFDSVQLKERINAHLQSRAGSEESEVKQAKPRDAALAPGVEGAGKTGVERQGLASKLTTDEVTGVGSRAFFLYNGAQMLAHAELHGCKVMIMQLAIDDFRQLFMRLARPGTNSMLASIGKILSCHVRKGDMVARTSIDSFTVLFYVSAVEDALKLAERIRDKVANTKISHLDTTYQMTVSIGISQAELSQGTTIEDLLAQSSGSLGQAQGNGGNCIVVDAVISQTDTADMGKETTVGKVIAIEQALTMMQTGKARYVLPHLKIIIKKLIPLFVLYDRFYKLGVHECLKTIGRSTRDSKSSRH